MEDKNVKEVVEDPKTVNPFAMVGYSDPLDDRNFRVSKEEQEDYAESRVGFVEGLTHSATWTALKMRSESSIGFEDQWKGTQKRYRPTKSEMRHINKELGWNDEAVMTVLRDLKTPKDIDSRIKIIKENLEYSQLQAQADIFDNLASGFTDAFVDPINWGVGFASSGLSTLARIGINTAGNVASGQLRERYTGVETSMLMDAASGLAFASIFEHLVPNKMSPFVKDTIRRSRMIEYARKHHTALPKEFYETPHGSNRLAVATDSIRQIVEDKVPDISIRGVVSRVLKNSDPNSTISQLLKNTYRMEEGIKVLNPDGTYSYNQLGEGVKVTASMLRRFYDNKWFNWRQSVNDPIEHMKKMGYSRESINDYLYAALEGRDVELPEDIAEDIMEINRLTKPYMKDFHDSLLERDMISGKGIKNYVPFIENYDKLRSFVDSFDGDNFDVKLKNATKWTKKALIEGVHTDSNARKEFFEIFKKEQEDAYNAQLKAKQDYDKALEKSKKEFDADEKVLKVKTENEREEEDLLNKAISDEEIYTKEINDLKSQKKKALDDLKAQKDADITPLYTEWRESEAKINVITKDSKGIIRVENSFEKNEKEARKNLEAKLSEKELAEQPWRKATEAKKRKASQEYSEAYLEHSKAKEALYRYRAKAQDFANRLDARLKKYEADAKNINKEFDKSISEKEKEYEKVKEDFNKKSKGISNKNEKLDKTRKEFIIKKSGIPVKDPRPLEERLTDENFEKWLDRKASETAEGRINRFNERESLEDTKNTQHNPAQNYRMSRLPWNNSVVVDGRKLDSIRGDFVDSIEDYSNYASGDLICYDTFGSNNFDETRKFLTDIYNEFKNSNDSKKMTKSQLEAVKKMLFQTQQRLYNLSVSRYDTKKNAIDALLETMRNLTFARYNTYMGILNHTEVAYSGRAYGTSIFLKQIPKVGEKFADWSKGKISEEDRRMINDIAFGREIKQFNIFGDVYRHALKRYNGNKFLASIVAGSEYAANALPTTKYLWASQESIVSVTHGAMLSEMIHRAYMGSYFKRGFINRNAMRRMNISDVDLYKMNRSLKEAFKLNKDGSIEIKDISRLLNSSDAMLTLRKFGEYVADETILRPDMIDNFLFADNQHQILALLMQFKTFALRSYHKRFVKSLNRSVEGEGTEEAITQMLSLGLATFGNIGITAFKSLGLDEEEQEKYLERSLGIKKLSDIPKNIPEIALASILRTSIASSFAVGLNAFGIGSGMKSTADASRFMKAPTIEDWFANQSPAVGFGDTLVRTAYDILNAVNVNYFDPDATEDDIYRAQKALARDQYRMSPSWGPLTNTINGWIKPEKPIDIKYY